MNDNLGHSTEAMIMSLPVAATSVGGVPEIVIHQETGLLSPPGDPAKLAANIIWLLDHPSQAYAMGEKARQKVTSEFSAERMIHRIENLYQDLIKENGFHSLS
jgi:glycosyltransferase involved in cell wall biosynthesis